MNIEEQKLEKKMNIVEEPDDSEVDAVDDENDGPVDIIKIQQDFYESFKPTLTDESAHGYSEVLNKLVLEEMITSNAMFNANMSNSEITSFSDCLWEQRKFTGSDILRISQLFVCCVYDENKGEKLSYPLNIKSTNFLIRSIYRVPKCFKESQNQRDCCAVFVDEFARVYRTWKDFCKKNKYGNCLIIAPKGGLYHASAENNVELEIFFQKDGIIKYIDGGSTVASIGSAAVVVAGMIPAITVGPAIASGAVAVGVVCAGYAAIRSVYQLFDRKKHDQSIGLGNAESRAAYFNIGSGVVCAGSAAGARAMTQAALNRKTISDVAQKTIRYVSYGGMAFQVTGCADELHTIISGLRKKKPISLVHFAQFGAQVFLLALTVKNYKLTKNLMETSGKRNPKSIRKILRQHNSDGSLKYLFRGADFIEKNIRGGVSSEVMVLSLLKNCLNVCENVKNECGKHVDLKLEEIINQLVEGKQIKRDESERIRILLEYFLNTMNLNSLYKFLELTKKCFDESTNVHKIRENPEISFEVFLKSIYILLIQEQDNCNNTNINDFISALTHDSFDMITDEIKLNENSIIVLRAQFNNDKDICSQIKVKLCLARKIYLIFEQRCQMFIKEFKQFIVNPIEVTLDNLTEAIEYVLKRLAIESATLFFGLIKQILNECGQSFVNQKFSQNNFIKESFQYLLSLCKSNLTILEKYIKENFSNKKNAAYYSFKKNFLAGVLSSKKERTLQKCRICLGKTFI